MTVLVLDGTVDLDVALAGAKARSVNRMRALGLAVPPAVALGTDSAAAVRAHDGRLTAAVSEALREGVRRLEDDTGCGLGDDDRPLLVSVRSSGAVSMPGMMDTVLNVGVTDAAARRLGPFGADVRRRFDAQFAAVAGVPATFDPWTDLVTATEAVFASWNSPRATAYRAHHGIAEAGGCAVVLQAMVFGNRGPDSGTGVLFTRDPLTGAPGPFGDWLPGGQGEDVVSGRVDPLGLAALAADLPEVHRELVSAATLLERDAGDAQDVEFTVEAGRLWLLQTRGAKRTAQAAVRIAVDLAEEGVIGRADAVAMVPADVLARAAAPHVDPDARRGATVLASGVPACPGVATGRVVTTCDEATDLGDAGVPVVLARPTTDPADVTGMMAAVAVVTEIGGTTSHAAVVSRELGTPCVVGCGMGTLDGLAGRVVTVDGAGGEVLDGVLPVAADRDLGVAAARLRAWASGSHGTGQDPSPSGRPADAPVSRLGHAGNTAGRTR